MAVDRPHAIRPLPPSREKEAAMSDRSAADEILTHAYRLLQSGALDEVEAALSGLRAGEPGHINALHMRGLAHGMAGRMDMALSLLEEAHRLCPEDADLTGNLAKAYARAKRYPEALRLNDALLCAGRIDAERLCDSGIMLLELGRDAEALSFFNLALEADPAHAPAWAAKAKLMVRYEDCLEALLCYDRAVLLQPQRASHHAGRGVALAMLGHIEEAMRDHQRALALEPESPDAWIAMATTLIRGYRPEESLDAACRAIALGGPSVERLCIRAEALLELNRTEEALRDYEDALQRDPSCPRVGYQPAYALLSCGDFAAGWKAYEHRWDKAMHARPRHQNLPRWSGADSLAGKRILLWAEQGLGDVIQHCRFALDVQRLGARIVLETERSLLELCRSLPVDEVIAIDEAHSPCDCQIPLASLPLALKLRSDSIPHAEGYLRTPPQYIGAWAAALPPARKPLRIGIACSGNPSHSRDRMRSMPLRYFLPLCDVAELFILQPVLQKDDEALQRLHPEIHRLPINGDNFADTAGLVENMDLVISVDTSIAHLAGSLGKPVWILLDRAAEWRWMREISYSPWYRSARLFRQEARGDWTSVIRQTLAALRERQRQLADEGARLS
jgi:tetratricopeptide (TPR) repeat protein